MLIRKIQSRIKNWAETLRSEIRQRQIRRHCIRHRKIPVFWFSAKVNFGDVLNAYLVEKISGRIAHLIKPWRFRYTNYFVIGSVLSLVNRNSIVWGAGFIHPDKLFDAPPRRILAVRGPLTRQRLLDRGISCPEVYGDPALLMPRYFNPRVTPTRRLGLIPHFSDKEHPWVQQVSSQDGVTLIDIQTDDVEGFIREVLACEHIVSSSLHGVIIADAYQIPAMWVPLSEDVGEFKFCDYFLSVGRDPNDAKLLPKETDLDSLLSTFTPYEIGIDLDLLQSQCPFADATSRLNQKPTSALTR